MKRPQSDGYQEHARQEQARRSLPPWLQGGPEHYRPWHPIEPTPPLTLAEAVTILSLTLQGWLKAITRK